MSWEETKLSEITLKIASGSTPRGGKESYKESGITLIRSLNVYDFKFKYKDLAFIDEIQAKKLSNVIIEEDDILLNITGASVGRCTMVPKHLLPARINQHVMIIRINDKLADANFILYMINSPQYKMSLMSLAETGATREALTKDDISNFKINLPPLKTQQKIASLLSNYDKLIENNTQRITLLESMAEELYKEWFVRLRFPGHEEVEVVDGVPEGWERKSLKDICTFFNGKTAVKSDEGIYPIYGANGRIGYSEDFNYENIIIVGRVGVYCGSVFHIEEKCWATDNTIVIKPSIDEILFIKYYLKFQNLNNYAGGSAQPLLTQTQIKSLLISYPPSNLIQKYHKISEDLIRQSSIIEEKNQTLKQTRDLLLPRLMSGKLNVEDLDII